MNEFYDIANAVYKKLADDMSKSIFRAGISYNLTKDEESLDSTLIELFRARCLEGLSAFCNKDGNGLFIFGTGTWGRRIYNICRNDGINVCGWIDNTVRDRQKQGLEVYKPDEVSKPETKKVIVAVEKCSTEIVEQLLKLSFSKENIYDLGLVIKEQAKELEKLQYFDLDEMKPSGHDVFVDCGAFDGMSSERFIQWSKHQYDKIYMFEANDELYDVCKKVSDCHSNCQLINKGVWNENKNLEFYESPYDKEYNVDITDHNCLDNSKKKEGWKVHQIPVVKMDDVIDGPITFLKMDIEGSEAAAIEGAEKLIRTYKPMCSISVYHKPNDLWTIPSLLLQYNPDYRLFLRHYSLGWGETVLYAVNPNM